MEIIFGTHPLQKDPIWEYNSFSYADPFIGNGLEVKMDRMNKISKKIREV